MWKASKILIFLIAETSFRTFHSVRHFASAFPAGQRNLSEGSGYLFKSHKEETRGKSLSEQKIAPDVSWVAKSRAGARGWGDGGLAEA